MWALFQVFKSELYGKRFQWIFYSDTYVIFDAIARADITDGCTSDDITAAAEGAFVFHPRDREESLYSTEIGDHGMVGATNNS